MNTVYLRGNFFGVSQAAIKDKPAIDARKIIPQYECIFIIPDYEHSSFIFQLLFLHPLNPSYEKNHHGDFEIASLYACPENSDPETNPDQDPD